MDETYFNDGGIFATVSTTYLTRETAKAILGDRVEDEFDDEEYAGYLEGITPIRKRLNGMKASLLEDCIVSFVFLHSRNWYSITSILVSQNAIGAPPYVAVAERDGQVIAIKLFSEKIGYEEGFVYDSQPGKVIF